MNRYYIEKEQDEASKLLSSLQNAARASRTEMARKLLPTGLHAGQESVIELLMVQDGQTPGQIAGKLGVRPPTITKTISRLQEQGFVERRASADDARQICVFLTDEGRAVVEEMSQAIRQSEKRALNGLKKKERKQLGKLLVRIQENLTGELPKRGRKPGSKKKKDAKSAA